jgi:hypothetical protein
MKNLIITADIKKYLPQLDIEEISISRFAEILNELANERSRNYIISDFDAVETLINQLENIKTMKKLILILSVMSLISCKKDEPYSLNLNAIAELFEHCTQ